MNVAVHDAERHTGPQSAELGVYVRLQVMQLPWIGSEKKSKELFFSFCYYRGQQKAALKKKNMTASWIV